MEPSKESLVLRPRDTDPVRAITPSVSRAPYPDPALTASDQELSSNTIHEYLQALLRRKWLIATITVLGLIVGFATMIPEPLPYPARTIIEVHGLNESFMRMNEVDPQASSGTYSATPVNLLTQARIISSNTLRRRALDKLEREMIPSVPPSGTGLASLLNAVRGWLGLNPTEPTRALRQALESASRSMNARLVGDTRLIEIGCESPHPEVSAEYVNTLVNEYVDMNLESRAAGARRTGQWLTNQLEEQKARLEQSEGRLRDFVAESGVPGLVQEDARNTLAQTRLQHLQGNLAAIQSERILKQTRYEAAVSKGVEAVPELTANSQLTVLQTQLADFQRRKAEMLTAFTPKHFKVVALQSQIDALEGDIRKEKEKLIERARSEYETSLRQERMLTGAYSGQSGTLLSQSDKALQYNMLKREVDSNRQIYNTMVQQVNQASVASAVPTNNVRVIDAATPPFSPSYREVYIATGLGGVTGLLFGGVLAIILKQLDRRLRSPGQLETVLNLRELGVIPSEFAVEKRWGLHLPQRSRWPRSPSARDGAPGRLGLGDEQSRIELVTHQQKPSPVAESFRATLTSILFSVEGRKHAVWSVTSPNPREGKSTVTSNLAIALAELHRRVVVVDGDLRKPRLHEVFDVANTWGVSDILQEEMPIDQYPPDSLARPSSIPGVFVLPSGPAVQVINTLLCSDRLPRLLQRLREDFDAVLVDTPPMMMLPDARIIGQHCDAVILVFRAGASSIADARGASKRLFEDGIPVLGTVLNDWNPASSGQSRYYRHYKYHHGYYVSDRS